MIFLPAVIHNMASTEQAFTALEAIDLDTPPYNEDWLQTLIHKHPKLVPAGEVEACFENLVPVLREFPLPSGYLDNLYITPEGYPVLVEVKLWKNQEARRKVVAQILEYAKDFAALPYEEINTQIRKQIQDKKWGPNPLHEIISAYVANPPAEANFVDRVSRNLREGRFLLLILGDGIREEMAALADYLMHHSLRYAFGMVEIRLFKLPGGDVLALPRVLSKTQTIERHVTVVSTQGQGISVIAQSSVVNERVEKTSLSTDEFYELLDQQSSGNAAWLKELTSKLSDLPLDIQAGSRGESLMIKAPAPDGGQMQLILITPSGVEFWGVPNKNLKDPSWQALSRRYLEKISEALPGSSIKTFASGHMDIKMGDRKVSPAAFQGKADMLSEAMRQVLKEADLYYEAAPAERAASGNQ